MSTSQPPPICASSSALLEQLHHSGSAIITLKKTLNTYPGVNECVKSNGDCVEVFEHQGLVLGEDKHACQGVLLCVYVWNGVRKKKKKTF